MFGHYIYLLGLLVWCSVLTPDVYSLGMIRPTAPPQVLFANINSTSYYAFNFQIETELPVSSYVAITFPNFTSLTSPYCLFGVNTTAASASSPCSSVNNTLYVNTPTILTAWDSIYILTTFTEVQTNSGFSDLFTLSTQTTNTDQYFIFDENPTFGSVYWSAATALNLYVNLQSYGTAATANVLGTTNIAQVLLRIGADTPGNRTVLYIIADEPFTFSPSVNVTTADSPELIIAQNSFRSTDSYIAPVGLYAELVNPNELHVNFDQRLTSGREFLLNIDSIINPNQLASGYLSFYFMSQNSSQILESNTQSVAVSVVTSSLSLSVDLASGIPWSATSTDPVNLYKNDRVTLRVSFTTEDTIPAGSTVLLTINDDNAFVGLSTIYFSPDLQNMDPTQPLAYVYTYDQIQITELAAIPANTTLFIQFALQTSLAQPTLNTSLTISLGSETFYNATAVRHLETAASSMLTSMVGSSNEEGIIDQDSSPELDLKLTVLGDDGINGSYMDIFLPAYITEGTGGIAVQLVASGSSFTPNAVTFTPGTGYNLLKIDSTAGSNHFTSALTEIIITNFNLGLNSNNQDTIYELYLSLVRDPTGTDSRNLHTNFIVIPTRNTLGNLYTDYGNLRQTNTDPTTQAFPNFIRVLGEAGAIPLTPTDEQTAVLTVYKQEGWDTVISFSDGESYPCASNLDVTCTALSGSALTDTDFQFWSRIKIELPSDIATSDFDLYLPFFHPSTNTWNFEFTLGLLDTTTGIETVMYIQDTLSFTPTDTSSGTQIPDLELEFNGEFAGGLVSALPFDVATTSTHVGNSAGGPFSAVTVLAINWDFWNSESVFSGIANPFDSAAINEPIATTYLTTFGLTWNLLFVPMVNTAAVTTPVRFILNNVYMPFALDVPDYHIWQTSSTDHRVSGYNSFINTNRAVLQENQIVNSGLSCTKMVQGYSNSYCTVQFSPRSLISMNAILEIEFDTGFPSTDTCVIQYGSPAVTIPTSEYTCQSDVNVLNVTFSADTNYPINQLYTVAFYGLDHSTSADNVLRIRMYSEEMGYLIQESTKSYSLPYNNLDYITIDAINYAYLNRDSTSALQLYFTISRNRYPNEQLELDLGINIQSNNRDTTKLSIILTNLATNTRLSVQGAITTDKITLIFTSNTDLSLGSYSLQLINLRTPSTHDANELKLRLKRVYDSAFTMYQNPLVTLNYPTLYFQVATTIILSSAKYMCVGCLSQLEFTVTSANSIIDSSSTFYFSFPSYYSPGLANSIEDLQCLINSDNIFCENDPDYPYLLSLSSSPVFLNIGDTFTITVFGVRVPDPSPNSTDDIFFAIDAWNNQTYSEQGSIDTPEIQTLTGSDSIGTIVLYDVTASTYVIRTDAVYTLKANLTADLPAGSYILIDFPAEFSNFKYISNMSCAISAVESDGLTYTGYSDSECDVIGKTTKFLLIQAVTAGDTLIFTLGDVPNPLTGSDVNFGTIEITAFDSTQTTLLARSNAGYNQATKWAFGGLSKYVEANNGQDIYVTVGTYSDDITVTTNDGTRFVQDVIITANTSGFEFVPTVLNFYIGDLSSTFKIGCDKAVKIGTYPLLLSQTEDSIITSTYGSLFNLKVFVVATQVEIVIPESIDVQQDGYSLPYLVQLPNIPFSNVVIRVNIEYATYGESFKVDEDFSSPVLVFTLDTTSNLIAVYASKDAVGKTLTATLSLDGDEYQSYKLSQDSITFNLITTTVEDPTITAEAGSTTKISADIELNPNQEGVFVYQLTTCGSQLALSELRDQLRNNSFQTIETEQSFCFTRYAIEILDSAGPSTLKLTGLTPDTDYTLYGYFINDLKNVTEPVKVTFQTQPLGTTYKLKVTLTREIFFDELNNLICFALRLFQTRIMNLVDERGLSCSNYIDATNNFIEYQGTNNASTSEYFNLYLFPDRDTEDDDTTNIINTYFDSTTKSALPSTLSAATDEGIDFIEAFDVATAFTYQEAKNSQDPIKRADIRGDFSVDYDSTDATAIVRLNNVELTTDGAIFVTLSRIAGLVPDPDDDYGYLDVPEKTPRSSTTEQIFRCLNWQNQTAEGCGRGAYTVGQPVTLSIPNIPKDAVYYIAYAVSNEYPLEGFFTSRIRYKRVRVFASAVVLQPGLAIVAAMAGLVLWFMY